MRVGVRAWGTAQCDVPRTDDFDEDLLVGCRAIPELTIEVPTRGPHGAVVLQHQAVLAACSHGLNVACSHGCDDRE